MKSSRIVVAGSLLAALAFLAILLSLFPVHYGTNDDIGLLWALKDGAGLSRDAFAIFNSRAFNETLFALYGLAPGVPWWGLALFAATGAAIAMLFALLARAAGRALFVLPSVLYFLALCVLYANITVATLLLAAACLLWMQRASFGPARGGAFWIALALAFSASLLMRWNVAVGFLVFALPVLATAALRARDPARAPETASAPLPLALILLLAGGLLAADRIAYRASLDAEQRAFLRYENVRNRFHATPGGFEYPEKTPRALAAAGWTREDYAFYRSWILHDDSLFNPRTLKAFLDENAPEGALSQAGGSLQRMLGSAWGAKKHFLLFGLGLFALILLAIPARGAAWHWRRVLPFSLPVSALAALLFFMQHRFVERVYIPLFLLALVGGLVALAREPEAPRSRARRRLLWTLFGLQALAALYLLWGHARQLRQDREDAAFVSACVEERARSAGTTLFAYLHPGSGLSLEKIQPLRERFAPGIPPIMPDGFWTASPRYREALRMLGYPSGRAFLRGAVDHAGIDWVLQEGSTAPPGMLSKWEEYYRRNLGVAMRLEPAKACEGPRGKLTFYRMKKGGR